MADELSNDQVDSILARMDTLPNMSHPDAGNAALTVEERVRRLTASHVRAGSNWQTTQAGLQQNFPSVDATAVEPIYQNMDMERRLRRERRAQEGTEEGVGEYLARRAIPYYSSIRGFTDTVGYQNAVNRFREGKATQEDLQNIAHFERLQEIDKNRTVGESILSGIAHIPALYGEYRTSGLLVSRGAVPAAKAVLPTFLRRLAATTAATPATWLPQLAQRNLENEHTGFSRLADLPAAFTMGMAQNAIIGSVNQWAGTPAAGTGLQGIVRGTVRGTVTGLIEQHVGLELGAPLIDKIVEPLAGAINKELPATLRLHTGHGLLATAIRGEYGEAWKQLAVSTATFAVFAGIHSLQGGPHEVRSTTEGAIKELAKKEVPPEQVPARLLEIKAKLQEPGAREVVENLPEGPMKDFAEAQLRVIEAIQHQPAQGPSPGLEAMPEGRPIANYQGLPPLRPGAPAAMPNAPALPSPAVPRPVGPSPTEPVAPPPRPPQAPPVNEPVRVPVAAPEPTRPLKERQGRAWTPEQIQAREELNRQLEIHRLAAGQERGGGSTAFSKEHGLVRTVPDQLHDAIHATDLPESHKTALELALMGASYRVGGKLMKMSHEYFGKLYKEAMRELRERHPDIAEAIGQVQEGNARKIAETFESLRQQAAETSDQAAQRDLLKRQDEVLNQLIEIEDLHTEGLVDNITNAANEKGVSREQIQQRLDDALAKSVAAAGGQILPGDAGKPASFREYLRKRIQERIAASKNPAEGEAGPRVQPAEEGQRPAEASGRGAEADSGTATSPPAERSETGGNVVEPGFGKPMTAAEQRNLPGGGQETDPLVLKHQKELSDAKAEAAKVFSSSAIDEAIQRGTEAGQAEADASSPAVPPREPGATPGERPGPGEPAPDLARRVAELAALFEPGFGRPMTPAEQRTIPGGGQENAPEGGTVLRTGLAKEVFNAERRLAKQAEIEKQASQADEKLWAEAKAASHEQVSQLIDETFKNPRPLKAAESFMVLRRRLELHNEIGRVTNEYIEAGREKPFNKEKNAALEAKFDRLVEQSDITDTVADRIGSEAGRTLRVHQLMARYDFSLDGLLSKAIRAKKGKLEPKDVAELKEMSDKIAELQKKLDEAAKAMEAAKEGGKGPKTEEWKKANTEANITQIKSTQKIASWHWDNLSTGQRALELWRRFRIFQLISGPITALKVATSSTIQPFAFSAYELIGSVLRQLPGIKTIAGKATFEGRGFDPAAEAAALKSTGQGFKDARDIMKRGYSDLDADFGDRQDTGRPRLLIDLVGNFHAAEKAQAVRNSFERVKEHLLQSYRQAGKDVNSEAVQREIGHQAYQESLRAKFQQDSVVVDRFNQFVRNLKQPTNNIGAQAVGHIIDTLLPIRRTPYSIVVSALEHVLGVPLGAARTALALRAGEQALTAADANSIMRQLKRGSLGLALLATGYALGDKVLGGMYSGRRKDEEIKPGEIDTPLGRMPAWVSAHHPAMMALHLGGAWKREETKKRQGGPSTPGAGLHALGALLEEVPYIREMEEGHQIFSGQERAWGRLVKSLTVPAFLNFIAEQSDKADSGQPVHRYPQNVMQHVETGIPGLRQQVRATRPVPVGR